MNTRSLTLLLLAVFIQNAVPQAADWQAVVWREPQVRYLLADMTPNGGRTDLYRKYATEERDPDSMEALRCWDAGGHAVNTNHFERVGGRSPKLVFRRTNQRFDPFHIRLNSDAPWPETNVRYFMADIALGGSIEFYRAAERDHEMGCLEAVRRTEEGYCITNFDEFERRRVDSRVVITRKGSNERISGMMVKLSSD